MLSIEKQILFLLSRTSGMEAKQLIQIYTRLDYVEQSIRNVLSRLKKEGLIEATARSCYRITAQGREVLQSVSSKPSLYNRTWDKTWCFVMLEISENERKKRDRFRSALLQLGFGHLYKSVYVSPWDYSAEVSQLIRSAGIEQYVTVTRSSIVCNEITAERSKTIWPLEALNVHYQEKWRWYLESFLPSLQQSISQKAAPLDLFIHYLHIGEVISELSLRDPMLPAELLPSDWAGKTILNEFYRTFQSFAVLIPKDSPYQAFMDTSIHLPG
jgi:phenylacetic acid degradation operon negative regulatory protein